MEVMIVTILDDSVLVESKSARENQLATINEERATEILNKIKLLYFSLFQGEGIATTEKLADFFEVETATIRQIRKRHSEEFNGDGVKTLRGKTLSDVRDTLSLTSRQSSITVWTPRSALRLGMLLRDSEVAKAVRTTLLNALEKVIPAQAIEIEKLRLENENLHLQLKVAKAQGEKAIAQEKLLSASQLLAIINPSLPALVLGKSDAVVTKTEVVEKTVLVNSSGRAIAVYEGLSKTKLAKRYGLKKATDLVDWLKSIGKEDVLKPGLTAAPCHYIPWEEIAQLDKLWASRQGSRQILIGEQ